MKRFIVNGHGGSGAFWGRGGLDRGWEGAAAEERRVGEAGPRVVDWKVSVGGEGVEGQIQVQEVDAGFAEEAKLAGGGVLVDEVGEGGLG